MEDAEIELWGGRILSAFLLRLHQNNGIANLRYTEHALERLEVSLSSVHSLSVHSLIDHINDAIGGNQFAGEELRYIMQYKTDLEQLVSYLQLIANEWQSYADTFYAGQRSPGAYRYLECQVAAVDSQSFRLKGNNWNI